MALRVLIRSLGFVPSTVEKSLEVLGWEKNDPINLLQKSPWLLSGDYVRGEQSRGRVRRRPVCREAPWTVLIPALPC